MTLWKSANDGVNDLGSHWGCRHAAESVMMLERFRLAESLISGLRADAAASQVTVRVL